MNKEEEKQVVQVSGEQWSSIQAALKSSVGEEDFQSWLEPLQPNLAASTSETLVLSVPTRFIQDWIQDNYTDVLRQSVTNTLQKFVNIDYVVAPDAQGQDWLAPVQPVASAPVSEAPATDEGVKEGTAFNLKDTRLDPRYTFETYVTGKSNEFAFAAAQRIAESLDAAYNPFFLHGGVGLGKTHLMHAVGWKAIETRPGTTVLYLSAEQFLYRFIRAIRDKSTLSFKETFRAVDVLMIDDIQFIAGKEATQEEFFHTFNALVGMGKQIILTADKSPHEMANIEDRLRSRLGSGLTCEIHPPEVETRLAILQKKADDMLIDLPQDVAMFLAHSIASNVRELEGALNRLAAHAKFTGAAITTDFAQEQLRDLFRANTRAVTLDEIQKQVADYFHIKISDMHSARRSRDIARPRQIAMYLCKNLTSKSYPEIGKSFGGKDHTTVMHGVRNIENLMEKDASLDEDVRLLQKMLKA